MLVYEKAEKKPLKVVCSEENINFIKSQPASLIDRLKTETALSCDGTAIRRDYNKINSASSQQLEEEKKSESVNAVDSDQQMTSPAGLIDTSGANSSAQRL